MGRRGRNAAAATGLAATVILGTGFLVVTLNRASQSNPGWALAPSKIQWHSTNVPAQLGLGPFLAASGGRLYMVGIGREMAARKVQVWSSVDAAHWEQVANPGFEPDFVPRATVAYGQGGLVVVGELTPSEAVVPQIWLSADGKTFAKAQIPPPDISPGTGTGSGEIVSAAVAAGQMVAFGDHDIVGVAKGTDKGTEVRGLDSWHSTDGSTWTHTDLAGSDGYSAISMTAWSGGFAALATQPGVDAGYGVWTSPDGIAWDRVRRIAAFGAQAIVALPHRLVVVGSKQDASLGMVPASWSSADGTSWTESAAPVSGFGATFDAATVVGSSVVAIGVSHVGSAVAAGVPSPSMPALVPPSVWISSDGSAWQLLGAAPAFQPYLTSMAAFDGHVVVATISGVAEVTVSVGDLSGAAGQ
ncbi:MAG: hypothetical protein ABSE58_09865 [Candidatus Limnocylindrales bacterium]|jgi:hypothetical protein